MFQAPRDYIMYLGSGDWFGAVAGNTHLDSAAFLNHQTDHMTEISREREGRQQGRR